MSSIDEKIAKRDAVLVSAFLVAEATDFSKDWLSYFDDVQTFIAAYKGSITLLSMGNIGNLSRSLLIQ